MTEALLCILCVQVDLSFRVFLHCHSITSLSQILHSDTSAAMRESVWIKPSVLVTVTFIRGTELLCSYCLVDLFHINYRHSKGRYVKNKNEDGLVRNCHTDIRHLFCETKSFSMLRLTIKLHVCICVRIYFANRMVLSNTQLLLTLAVGFLDFIYDIQSEKCLPHVQTWKKKNQFAQAYLNCA